MSVHNFIFELFNFKIYFLGVIGYANKIYHKSFIEIRNY
jgi:hypothetical protein